MAGGVGQGLSVRFLGGSDHYIFLLKFCCNLLGGGSARVCQSVFRPPPPVVEVGGLFFINFFFTIKF